MENKYFKNNEDFLYFKDFLKIDFTTYILNKQKETKQANETISNKVLFLK